MACVLAGGWTGRRHRRTLDAEGLRPGPVSARLSARFLETPTMPRLESIAKFAVPLGGQEIELQSVAFDTGGPEFLRVRIREGRRHTVFDIDAGTAGAWAGAMAAWAASREAPP
jgi:hypothetical protein